MKRLFIAVNISEQARVFVANYIDTLRERFPESRVKWEQPQKLHLTIKFLGDVDEDRVDEIAFALKGVANEFKQFRVPLGGTGVFPAARRPKIIWLGVIDEQNKLVTLSRSIDKACSQLGFESEARPFRPHLSIGRIRDSRTAR